MKVSYVSDLHNEFGFYYPFDNDDGGDVLVIAGDFCQSAQFRPHRTDKDARKFQKYLDTTFRKNVVDKYAYILYVIGNHEHYNGIYSNTKRELQDGFRRLGLDKIWVIDNNVVQLGDVTFFGGTLWTNYNNYSPHEMMLCHNGMNDYRLIGINDKTTITPDFIADQHKQYVSFIDTTAQMFKDNKKVVITHHGPTRKSLNSLHIGNGLDAAFASDLSNLILDRQIDYWIHGHTHASCNYKVGDCTVVSNQRGYAFEPSSRNFKGLASFEI